MHNLIFLKLQKIFSKYILCLVFLLCKFMYFYNFYVKIFKIIKVIWLIKNLLIAKQVCLHYFSSNILSFNWFDFHLYAQIILNHECKHNLIENQYFICYFLFNCKIICVETLFSKQRFDLVYILTISNHFHHKYWNNLNQRKYLGWKYKINF